MFSQFLLQKEPHLIKLVMRPASLRSKSEAVEMFCPCDFTMEIRWRCRLPAAMISLQPRIKSEQLIEFLSSNNRDCVIAPSYFMPNLPFDLQSTDCLYFNQGGLGGGPSAQMSGGPLQQL